MIDQLILEYETALRASMFAAILGIMWFWERLQPRRPLGPQKPLRWLRNLSLVILDTLCIRALALLSTAALAWGAAVLADERGWGLLNMLAIPYPAAFVAGFLALDAAIYAQHVAFHKIPVLWRVHRVHHSDLEVDVSTGVRFHPIEIVVSMGWKVLCVLALGIPAGAVIIFEVVLNGVAMFNHSNVRIKRPLDKWLRLFVITPDMHRVHHSVHRDETDSNFGFNLPWWDYLFRTYRSQPRDGHEGMCLGLAESQNGSEQGLTWLLALPFRRLAGKKTPSSRGSWE